jgi:hypothetical protein
MTDATTQPSSEAAAVDAPPPGPAWWWAPRTGWQAAGVTLLCAGAAIAAGPDGPVGGWQRSVRLLGALLLAGLVVHGVSIATVRLVAGPRGPGRRPRARTSALAVPLALAFTVAARAAHLQPGLVLVGALSFGVVARTPVRAVAAVIARATVGIVLAALGWIGYSVLVHHSATAFVRWRQIDPDQWLRLANLLDYLTLIGAETLAALAVVAAGSVLVCLLPQHDGAALWRAQPAVWAIAFALAGTVAMAIAVPPGTSWWAGLIVVSPVAVFALATSRLRASGAATPEPDAAAGAGS